MRSVAPKDYQSLPELKTPAAYILVMRDIDSDAFRIEGTYQPAAFVDVVLNEEERDFGIELVSILETEDIHASASELYEQHHATLGGEWLYLDPYQLQELKNSIRQINSHSSHYLAPRRPPQLESREQPEEDPQSEKSASFLLRGSRESPRRLRRRRMIQRPAIYKQYGVRALWQNRVRSRLLQQQEASQRASVKQTLSEGFDKLMLNHPWLVLLVLVTILLICLLSLEPMGNYGMPD